MYERSFGTSPYQPTRLHERKPYESGGRSTVHKPLTQRIKRWTIFLILALLFLIWFFIGDFRFLLWRYPSLSGLPFGTRSYLVLFQNNYELRPTGGFISSYGVLRFSHGFYSSMDVYDVYGEVDEHEYIEPPLVLSTLLEHEDYQGHTFRDANYDPDFRLSKEELIQFYQLTHPEEKIDGILAVDFHFLEQMVGLYEPMEVEGYILSQENLFETLSTVVSDIDHHNEEALENRKNIASPLLQKVLRKSLILPWRLLAVRDLFIQAFEEKHALASFNRSGLQKAFHIRNWDGALPQSDMGDFLAINEGNYGGMKSDRYFTRDVQYELEVTDRVDVLGNPVVKARVHITLSHEGGNNPPLSGSYTGYLRTMIPLGSNIEQGGSVSEDREDVSVLGELVTLNPGESVTYTYQYELPEYIWNEGIYYLHLHKQAGTHADRYRVVVRIPQGMELLSEQMDVRENLGFFETQLLTDTDLMFHLAEDQDPPRIVSHEITALNEITLLFNEALNPEHAEDPLNFKLTDLNYAQEEITDELQIVDIRVEGPLVVLMTEGMTPQADERYELILRGLTDKKGNTIELNPRSLTVVQMKNALPETETPTETESNPETNE